MLTLALTGTIGSGKSSVLAAFAREGAATASADAIVHALYRGRAVTPVGEAFPEAIVDGAVDRAALSRLIAANDGALARLEAIVHPLVREEQETFVRTAAAAGRRLAVVEVPLLVETGAAGRFDVVATVSAPREVRLGRVIARSKWTEAWFAQLEGRQATDTEKRAAAHFTIVNDGGLGDLERRTAAVARALAPAAAGR